MKIFKAEKTPGQRHDVWVTELNLRSVNPARQVKLNKLLKLLKNKVVEVAL